MDEETKGMDLNELKKYYETQKEEENENELC